MWTLKEEIAPELKQELKPFIFDNVQELFSPLKFVTRTNTFSLEHSFLPELWKNVGPPYKRIHT